jgi:hypothetical protein
MPRQVARLQRWQEAVGGAPSKLLDTVRDALDDDLDTQAAVLAIDAAAEAGEDVTDGAALLGVVL